MPAQWPKALLTSRRPSRLGTQIRRRSLNAEKVPQALKLVGVLGLDLALKHVLPESGGSSLHAWPLQ